MEKVPPSPIFDVAAAIQDNNGMGSWFGLCAAERMAGASEPVKVSEIKLTSAKKIISNLPRSQTLPICWYSSGLSQSYGADAVRG